MYFLTYKLQQTPPIYIQPQGCWTKPAMAGAFDSENILAEILKRLPLKSLSQCSCVEKSWYDLIQSSYFKALYSDCNRFIYMLARLSNRNFVLYRMDPLLLKRI